MESAELHEYLRGKLGHNWRLETWRKKYEARLRVYGLEKCRIAVDGFCSIRWWVENKSQDAPDCIFRSDKSFERFLAAGLKLPEHSEESRKRAHEEAERKRLAEDVRERIEQEQAVMNSRMRVKLAELEDEISDAAYRTFIDPLLYVKYEAGVCTLYHENAAWVNDHYRVQIERTLGVRVKVVDAV